VTQRIETQEELYMRDDIKYEIILREKVISNCWCAAVEMKDKMIAVVYYSSNASDGDFIRFLEDIVDILVMKGQCVLIGDFNIDLMKDSFYAKKLTIKMSFLGIKQYIDKSTRVTKDSKTLID